MLTTLLEDAIKNLEESQRHEKLEKQLEKQEEERYIKELEEYTNTKEFNLILQLLTASYNSEIPFPKGYKNIVLTGNGFISRYDGEENSITIRQLVKYYRNLDIISYIRSKLETPLSFIVNYLPPNSQITYHTFFSKSSNR